jgi:hypothetical protein
MLTTLSSRSARARGRTIKRPSEQGAEAQKARNYCGLEAAPAPKKWATSQSCMSAGSHGIKTIGERFERISKAPREARVLLGQIGGVGIPGELPRVPKTVLALRSTFRRLGPLGLATAGGRFRVHLRRRS